MRHHGRAVFLDQKMPGPRQEIAETCPGERDHRIDGDETNDERNGADDHAEYMQHPRPLLRMVAEIMLPEIIEAFFAARHGRPHTP